MKGLTLNLRQSLAEARLHIWLVLIGSTHQSHCSNLDGPVCQSNEPKHIRFMYIQSTLCTPSIQNMKQLRPV